MKRNLLFIILCITTLTFLGCGKNETPVMSNSVETEVETETITTDEIIAEEVEEPTDDISNEITEETVENNQETTTSTEENTQGVVIQFEEGEYTGTNPDEPIIETETAEPEQEYEDPGLSVAIQNLKGLYDQGLLTEDEYKEMVAAVTSASQEMAEESTKPSTNTSSGYSQAELDPETQARLDAMTVTDEEANGLVKEDIEYGQGDYTGYEGDWIN